ncbi:Neuroligin 4-like [Bulinus truncatus]|nr:Neuroligin 4-like [Bulinus truncatus]
MSDPFQQVSLDNRGVLFQQHLSKCEAYITGWAPERNALADKAGSCLANGYNCNFRSPEGSSAFTLITSMATDHVSAIRSLRGLVRLAVLMLLLPDGSGKVILKHLSERVISTRYGKVRGMLVEFNPMNRLKNVEAFLGLRYGDLDAGGMRFMPPKNPKEQWNGIRVAVKHMPVCPQPKRHEREYSQQLPESRVAHLRNITPYLTDQKEDCLYLNLYVPKQAASSVRPEDNVWCQLGV